jgi:hypothetical protein
MLLILLVGISGASGAGLLTEIDILTSASCQPDSGVFSIPVDGYPDSLLPAGSSGLDLIPVRAADATELIAGVRMDGGWLVLDTLVFGGPWNEAKSWAWWDAEAQGVVLASQLPFRMYTWMTRWTPDEDGFTLESEWDEDASMDALESTLALLDSGRVEEASGQLFCILYPGWYFNGSEMAAAFLRASSLEAGRRAIEGDAEGALSAYLASFAVFQQCGLDSLWLLDAVSLGAGLNPVSQWMDDTELSELLDHLAATATAAGDGVLAAKAAAASAALNRTGD